MDAQNSAQTLKTAIGKGDAAASRQAVTNLQTSVSAARHALNDPTLVLASHVPIIGHNIMAPRVVGHVLYDVSQGPLPKLASLASDMTPAKVMPGGRVDLDVLRAAAPGLAETAPPMEDAKRRMHNIDTGFVLPQITASVTQVTDVIDGAANAVSTGARIAKIGPSMLDGHRTYLLVFQNNAEVRATGGLPGAWAELKADNGRISLGKQGTGGEIQFKKPVLRMTKDEEYLFTDKLVTDFRDFNFTPDWPRGAEIAAQMIKDHAELNVDGVVSVDPVAMSYLLRGTGPVTPQFGDTLTADNVIDTILNGTYLKYSENAEQDAYFAAATRAVFDAVTGPSINAEELGKGLAKAADERRLLLWSKDKSIEKELSGTAVSGEMLAGESDRPQLGFYMSDVSAAKMEYYLKYDVTVQTTKCTSDGAQTYHAALTFRSLAPANAARLPSYITGGSNRATGLRPGDMTLALNFFAPHGGEVLSVATRGLPRDPTIASFAPAQWAKRAVGQTTLTLKPGETTTLDVVLRSGKDSRDDADVALTPGSKPNQKTRFTVRSAC